MIQLPTLGGNNGEATAINNRVKWPDLRRTRRRTQAAQLPKCSTLSLSSGKKAGSTNSTRSAATRTESLL